MPLINRKPSVMTDDKIKTYFLGELSEAENAALEEEIAVDKTLFERAQMVESEIIEQYLRRNLTSAERDLFEKNYLITAERQRKVEFTRNFLKNLKNQTTEEKQGFLESFFASFNFAKAFAFAILLIIVGGFAYFIVRNFSPQTEVVKTINANQTPVIIEKTNDAKNINAIEKTDSNTKTEVNRNTANKTPEPTKTPAPTPKPVENSQPIFATLLPGTSRSGGEQFIKISPNTKQINIRLKPTDETAQYKKFRAVLKTAEGETISTFSNLKSLDLNLPAAKLENRTYVIFLEGISAENQPQSIAEYTFRIKK